MDDALFNEPLSRIETHLTDFQLPKTLSFNLDGIVTRAYEWLTALSWDLTLCASHMDTSENRDFSHTVEATHYYNSDAVFIDPATPVNMCLDTLIRLVHSTGGTCILPPWKATPGHIPIILDARGPMLVSALNDIIQALGIQYATADKMGEFAYAMMRGIHSVNSLAGHTDEGGLVRDMLRYSTVQKPVGIFTWSSGESEFKGHVSWYPNSRRSLVCVIDSLTLMTAGLVAVSDPGTVGKDGYLYPTVSGVNYAYGPVEQPAGNLAVQKDNIRPLTSPFLSNWIENVSHLLGYVGRASPSMLNHFMEATSGIVERHGGHEMLAPWYWVEPTSIITRSNYVTCPLASILQAGYADYKTGSTTYGLDPYSYHEINGGGLEAFELVKKFGSLRREPLLWALSQLELRNGKKGAMFIGGSFENLVCAGSGVTYNNWVKCEVSLAEAAWKNGDSHMPAPHELMMPGGGGYIVEVSPYYFEDNEFQNTGFPSKHDVMDKPISISCSRPAYIGLHPLEKTPRDVNRKRTAGYRVSPHNY